LVQYCYNKIGITIPRTSRLQYRTGAYIPPDRLDLLAPGDLVFFGYGGNPGAVHHVAMYVGDGKMIHAPQAGQLVSQSSLLERISRRGDYVGACRP
jgi:cell wall-associated NlpC family hydrolase